MLTVLREIYIIIGTSIFFILLVLTANIMHTAITPNIEPRYAPNVLFTKRQNNWNAIPAAYIISFFGPRKIPARDMSVFCRQFASILKAGVSVINALEMLGEQTENKRLKEAIERILQTTRSFTSLNHINKNTWKLFILPH